MQFSESDVQRFNAKVQKSDGCWTWSGAVKCKERPYGQFSVGKRKVKAHRAAWMLANGPIPSALHVLHRCDNPRCVNPSHLFLGTHQDNMADMNEKGRRTAQSGEAWHASHPPESFPRGDAVWTRRNPELVRRGSACHLAKLTEDQVADIRHTWASTKKKYGLRRDLAAAYDVDKTLIWQIVTNRIWTHV